MKIFLLDDVEIKIYKSSLAKKIILSIRPSRGVRVTIPRYTAYFEAEKFAVQKKEWIHETLKKLSEKIDHSPYLPISGFVTNHHELVLIPHPKPNKSVKISEGKILVKFDSSLNADSKEIRSLIQRGINKALKKEADEYLPERLKQLSINTQLPFNEVAVKNMKSRWGSCTGRNNINLTIHLMRLPEHLIDYVLMHELVHTIVKNHSRKYWQTLEFYCTNAKVFDKELKKYRIMSL
ncbi:MAG: SprT family zinc-dependent metalloprotease [Melioribacteraceae bacterium]